jgi:pSer/pThr/pTyr-binding forkhead associated (FHA) protein
MAMLTAVAGIPGPQDFPLMAERCILGRLPTHEVVIDNGAVSRTHAQITRVQGVFFLEDLRSRNGTSLNGEPIQGRGQVRLRDNDLIKICEVELRFVERTERIQPRLRQPDRDPTGVAGGRRVPAPPSATSRAGGRRGEFGRGSRTLDRGIDRTARSPRAEAAGHS